MPESALTTGKMTLEIDCTVFTINEDQRLLTRAAQKRDAIMRDQSSQIVKML